MEIIKKYTNKKFYLLYVLVLLILIPNILLIAVKLFDGHLFESLRAIYSLLVSTLLLLLVPIILNLNIKKYFYFLTPITIVIPIVSYIILIYHRTPARWMLYAVFNTTSSEIQEFTKGMWIWKSLILIFPLFITLLIKRIQINNINTTIKGKIGFVIAFLLLLFISFSFKTIQRKTINIPIKVVLRTTFKDTPIYTVERFIKALWNNNLTYHESEEKLFAISKNDINQKELYLIVIGESSRYINWQINGYNRQTSPYLMDLENFITLSDIISPSFITDISIPLIFSDAELADNDTKNTSLISVFNSAGFETCWISNQNYGKNNVSKIAKQSNQFKVLNCKPDACFDEVLIQELRKLLDSNARKQLIVLHLRGNHYPYHNRYPDDFKQFKPCLEKNIHILQNGSHREEIINSYDNSVLYSSYVLKSLIDMVNKTVDYASVVYLSDHGENLFDDGKNGFGRGFGEFTPNVFHVPLFIWLSDSYIRENPEKYQKIINNKDVPISLTHFFYSMLELANIQSEHQNSENSFFRDEPEEYTRYIMYNNKIKNFDKEKNN